jgi:DNA-binding response OmpR family regulator
MSTLSEHPEALSFGQTVVMLQRRELTRAGRRVEIGARAFDVLLMLMQSRGAPVTRDAIRVRFLPYEERLAMTAMQFVRSRDGVISL